MKLDKNTLKIFGILFVVGLIENVIVIYGRELFKSPWVGLIFLTALSTIIIKMSGLLKE